MATKKKPRCQCIKSCKNPPLKSSAFCRQHRFCERRSPLTGYEPKYNPELYNKKKGKKEVVAVVVVVASSCTLQKATRAPGNTKQCAAHATHNA